MEMQGFVLPSCKLALLTDRELFGQQLLASPTFVHPSHITSAKSVNPDELNVGDYVVHRKYGIGKFTRFETIEVKGEKQPHYIVEFADGKTAVAIAPENEKVLSRYRSASNKPPKLNSIANTKSWDNALSKCQKEIHKLARDLLQLYVRRANLVGYAFPPDTDWQQEMEDSFPYQLTLLFTSSLKCLLGKDLRINYICNKSCLMTICNGGIRLVELEILMVMLGQKDNGKSKINSHPIRSKLFKM
jgi:transcription-repair coupling factor (superfamily II helicase)